MMQQDVHPGLTPAQGTPSLWLWHPNPIPQPSWLPRCCCFLSPVPRLVPAELWVPEAPVLAVFSCWLPLTAVCGHLCSHSDGLCLGEHHGAAVEGH